MKCTLCGSENTFINQANNTGWCPSCNSYFTPEKPPLRELSVFFSYGHDENKVVVEALKERIEDKTEKRIKIWIDHEIKGGDNWRRKITEGILNSDRVLAFLTKHSIRVPGVCKDELAIAVGTKYGMVKSVLLEDEETVKPPSDIAENQWISMTDWTKHRDTDFDSYIDFHADEIIRMLDSPETEQFQGEITQLRQLLSLPFAGELTKFERVLKNVFVGREWLTKRVKDWLDDDNGARVLAVYGSPGTGKTAFSANLQHYHPDIIAAAISCDWQHPEYSSINDIIRRIAFRLALRLPDYRAMLIRILSSDENCQSSDEMMFQRLIAIPLGGLSIDGGHKRFAIVIDGLDESQGDTLSMFIEKYKSSFAPWVRILVTSRPEASIIERLNCATIDIDECRENLTDIRGYFVLALAEKLAVYGENETGAFIDRLTEASEGVFLYAEQICPLIIEDLDAGLPSLTKYRFPQGMGGLFEMSLERKFRHKDDYGVNAEYNRFWREPLGMICASPTPLPKSTLIKMQGWSNNDATHFFALLSTLLDVGDEVTPFHKSFADWLDTTKCAFHSSKADGTKALAAACYVSYKKGIDKMDRYELSCATRLLRAADMTDEYDELVEDDYFTGKMFELGNAYEDEYNHESALFVLTELLKIYKERFDKTKKSYYYSNYCVVLRSISDVYLSTRGFALATECAEKAVNISRKLAEAYPDAPVLQRDLGISLSKVGNIKKALNDYNGALVCYEEELIIFRKLAEAHPDDPGLHRGLGVSLEKVGSIKEALNDYDGALVCYEEYFNISRELAEAHPDDPSLQRGLGVALSRVGGIKEALNDYDGALVCYEEYFNISRELAEAHPDDPGLQRGLGISLSKVGGIKEALNDYDGALVCYREFMNISRKLAEAHPDDPGLQNGLGISLSKVGGIKEALKDYDGALVCYEEDLSITRKLAEAHPDDPGLQRGLGISLEKVGGIKEALKDYDGALVCYEEDLSITRKLAEAHPDDPGLQRGFYVSLFKVGCIKEMLNDYNGALEYLEQALRINTKLASKYPQAKQFEQDKVIISGLIEQIKS